jgi:hypothetical protein
MNEVFKIIGDLGFPIAAALAGGCFVYLTIKLLLAGVLSAIILCQELRAEFDGKMSAYYDMWIERCEFQKTQDLPEEWNGIFIATSK